MDDKTTTFSVISDSSSRSNSSVYSDSFFSRRRPTHFPTSLEEYRRNALKSNNPATQFEFYKYLLSFASQTDNSLIKDAVGREVISGLKKVSNVVVDASYVLALCYLKRAGDFNYRGKHEEWVKAVPCLIQAAKHNHLEAGFMVAECFEFGRGVKRNAVKAEQFYRKVAGRGHPQACYRMGMIRLSGEFGIEMNQAEAVIWFRKSISSANPCPLGLYQLALLYRDGIQNVIHVDYSFSLSLLVSSAELGLADAQFTLGLCYEYGEIGCQVDPSLSFHFYELAANQSHGKAMFGVASWYWTGSDDGCIEIDKQLAFSWALKATEKNISEAIRLVCYCYENGIGTEKDETLAAQWYRLETEQIL